MNEKTKKTIPIQKLFNEWEKDPEFCREYTMLKDEFILADQFIRTEKMSQEMFYATPTKTKKSPLSNERIISVTEDKKRVCY